MKKSIKSNDEKYFKLYAIDTYKGKTKKFIDTQFIEHTLDDLTQILETSDKGYHMMINPDTDYVFFGDCDGFRGSAKEFIKLLKGFLLSKYRIKVLSKDVSYTENKSKVGSFHYSIPKIYGSCKKIKDMHKKFYEQHLDIFSYTNKENKNITVIDTKIYSRHWFRYPDQSKEGVDGTSHIIINGKMADFVVEHIPDTSICIDDKKYVIVCGSNSKTSQKVCKDCDTDNHKVLREKPIDIKRIKNLFTNVPKTDNKLVVANSRVDHNKSASNKNHNNDASDIIVNSDNDSNDPKSLTEKLKEKMSPGFKLNLLRDILSGITSYDDYEKWTNIGMALKNESCDNIEFFELWHDWSSLSTKYDGKSATMKKWRSFTKMRGYSMEYLMTLLKTQSPDKYNNVKTLTEAQKIIRDHKKYYPDNECVITKLNSTPSSHNIIFTDTHCPIHANTHHLDQCSGSGMGQRFFEISKKGTACLKCTHQDCIGKICPQEGITLSKNEIKVLFMNNVDNRINNSINITNNYGKGSPIFDIRSVLKENPKIFDDTQLNHLIIKSFHESNIAIVDVILHMVKNTLCFCDSIWYVFDDSWKQCNSAPNRAITNLIKLYDDVKEFITNSTEIYGVEKRSHIDQIIKLCDNIENGKKNKGVVALLEEKLTINNAFDMNTNLIGFSNGVYDFDKMEFRKSIPSDMVRLSCGYDYCDEYEDKENVLNILKMMFSDDESINFFLSYIASAMCSKNESQLMMILKWENIRHKNLLIHLLLSTFGDYCSKISNLSQIEGTKNNISYLKSIRFIISNNLDKISSDDVDKLVFYKRIHNKKETNDLDIKFYTLCFCNNDLCT